MTDRDSELRQAEDSQRQVHVSYGDPEQFYDEDRRTTRVVKKRYETWVEDGQKVGRWDYVPADHSEADSRPRPSGRLPKDLADG